MWLKVKTPTSWSLTRNYAGVAVGKYHLFLHPWRSNKGNLEVINKFVTYAGSVFFLSHCFLSWPPHLCALSFIHDISYPLARTFAANNQILFWLTSYKVVPMVRTEGQAPGTPVLSHCHLGIRTTQYKHLATRDPELELKPAVLGAAETCKNLYHAAGLSVGIWGKSLSLFEKPLIALWGATVETPTCQCLYVGICIYQFWSFLLALGTQTHSCRTSFLKTLSLT